MKLTKTRLRSYKKKIREDSRLTEFQKKVLTAVLTIPDGQVRTYGWVASSIGAHGAARAVGNALSRNPYAPHVPCHRVVPSDGTAGGYSGGRKRKIELLRAEMPGGKSKCVW